MKNISAIPFDMKDLIEFYNKTHPEYEIFYDQKERNINRKMKKRRKDGNMASPLPVDVYEILEHLIEEKRKLDPDTSFIVDELPILLDGKLHFSLTMVDFLVILYIHTI